MEKRYKINSRYAGYRSFSDMFCIVAMIIGGVFFDAKQWIHNESMVIQLIIFLLFVTLLSALLAIPLFFIYRTHQLVINNHGIYQEMSFFGRVIKYKNVIWSDKVLAVRVIYGLQTVSESHSITIMDEANQLRQRQVINIKNWQEMTMTEVLNDFKSLGVSIRYSSMSQIQVNLRRAQKEGFGKRIDKVAGASAFLIIVSLILTQVDKWSTIYYGGFHYFWWGISIFMGMATVYWMWKEKNNDRHYFRLIIAGLLFSSSSAFLFLMMVLWISPIMSSKQQMTFEYHHTNKRHEDVWRAVDNPELEIYCRESKSQIKSPQTTTVIKMFSILRVNGDNLCLQSRFLSDGFMPHK